MISSALIKDLARSVGFDLCGITPSKHLPKNEAHFRDWLSKGYQSSLSYLERNTEKRFDPRLLVEGSLSAIVCAVSYKNRLSMGYPSDARCKIASYALNRDYHTSIREMLRELAAALQAQHPTLKGRMFVDTAPLAEKQLAVEAGLGWIGRQSLVVTPQYGTYILLGELIIMDRVDVYDSPFEGSRCGTCRRCVDACPNHAILFPQPMIDTHRCISCHTIEQQPTQTLKLDGWIFGCDACQSCCPYNQRTPLHRNPRFDPVFDPLALSPELWQQMTEEEFLETFGDTPLTRSGLRRIQRNITPHASNSCEEE